MRIEALTTEEALQIRGGKFKDFLLDLAIMIAYVVYHVIR